MPTWRKELADSQTAIRGSVFISFEHVCKLVNLCNIFDGISSGNETTILMNRLITWKSKPQKCLSFVTIGYLLALRNLDVIGVNTSLFVLSLVSGSFVLSLSQYLLLINLMMKEQIKLILATTEIVLIISLINCKNGVFIQLFNSQHLKK